MPPKFELSTSVAASLAAAALVTTLLPFVLGFVWKRRSGVSWRIFWAGALVFFVSQVVLRLPWQALLAKEMVRRTGGIGPLWTGFLLFASLTAGLFEETGRWVGYKTLLKRHRSRDEGVMYGLGHGGIEAFLLVGLSLFGLLVAGWLASHGVLKDPIVLGPLRTQFAMLTPLGVSASVVERISAMAIHVGLSLIVLRAVDPARPHIGWLFLAIGLHFAANASAVLLLRTIGAWPTEAELVLVGAAILTLGWSLDFPKPKPKPKPTPMPTPEHEREQNFRATDTF